MPVINSHIRGCILDETPASPYRCADTYDTQQYDSSSVAQGRSMETFPVRTGGKGHIGTAVRALGQASHASYACIKCNLRHAAMPAWGSRLCSLEVASQIDPRVFLPVVRHIISYMGPSGPHMHHRMGQIGICALYCRARAYNIT